jgi:hypothetical protein
VLPPTSRGVGSRGTRATWSSTSVSTGTGQRRHPSRRRARTRARDYRGDPGARALRGLSGQHSPRARWVATHHLVRGPGARRYRTRVARCPCSQSSTSRSRAIAPTTRICGTPRRRSARSSTTCAARDRPHRGRSLARGRRLGVPGVRRRTRAARRAAPSPSGRGAPSASWFPRSVVGQVRISEPAHAWAASPVRALASICWPRELLRRHVVRIGGARDVRQRSVSARFTSCGPLGS